MLHNASSHNHSKSPANSLNMRSGCIYYVVTTGWGLILSRCHVIGSRPVLRATIFLFALSTLLPLTIIF